MNEQRQRVGVWTVNAAEGTAVGMSIPVTADGDVFAVLTPIWSTADGVRVSIDWQASPDDMPAAQALALAEALRMVAGVPGPSLLRNFHVGLGLRHRGFRSGVGPHATR